MNIPKVIKNYLGSISIKVKGRCMKRQGAVELNVS
jgi:hypothetical protein